MKNTALSRRNGVHSQAAERFAATIHKRNEEHEQKYSLVVNGDARELDHQVAYISGKLPSEGRGTTRFRGIDHYFRIKGPEKHPFWFRYRKGYPARSRMGVKVKVDGRAFTRQEVELDLAPGTSDNKALAFYRLVARAAGGCTEIRLSTRGTIFLISHPEVWQATVEVVVSINRNLCSGRKLIASEIEPHGFTDDVMIKDVIDHYETLLGWKAYRTSLTMPELVSKSW